MVAKCFPLLIVNTAVCCEKVNEVHFMKKKEGIFFACPHLKPGLNPPRSRDRAVEHSSGEKNGGMMR